MGRARDPFLVVDQMLDAIVGIRQAAGIENVNTLSRDWVRMRAIERGFEIISEASRRLPDSLKEKEAEVPWSRIAGIGNVLRHDYDTVDAAILFTTIGTDLPLLEEALRRILDRL